MEETKKSEALSQEKLEQVSGGTCVPVHEPIINRVIRTDSRGNPTHWQGYCGDMEHDGPFHYVCPHCGGLLHEGFFGRLYCDPCDESWFVVSLHRREGFYPGC